MEAALAAADAFHIEDASFAVANSILLAHQIQFQIQ